MSIHVVIGTTRGPVAVQRITREESGVQSVVCLNGTVEALPISRAYNDFVRRGTGVVARDFGHDAFRVDLDGRIDQGVSWQLPVYVAHALDARGQLGNGLPAPGDTVIWATGEVGADGVVRPVERTADKLERSQASITQWREQGVVVRLLLPDANVHDGAERIANLAGVAGVRTLAEATADLREPGDDTAGDRGDAPAPGRNRLLHLLPRGRSAVLLGVALLVLAGLWWYFDGATPATEVIILDDFGGRVERPAAGPTEK